eukprot:scaffold295306_cov48-Prasinocladus_malaysianus.AAC.2
MAALAEKQAELKAVEDKLQLLNNELAAAQEKKATLEVRSLASQAAFEYRCRGPAVHGEADEGPGSDHGAWRREDAMDGGRQAAGRPQGAAGGGHPAGRRRGVLLWALHEQLPRPRPGALAPPAAREGHPGQRGLLARQHPRQPRQVTAVEPPRAPQGRLLIQQRHRHVQLPQVLPLHRSAGKKARLDDIPNSLQMNGWSGQGLPRGPGQQVDPQHGGGVGPERDQAGRLQLHADARDGPPVWTARPAGECRLCAGRRAGPRAQQGPLQAGRGPDGPAGRQRGRVARRLPLLRHNQAAQPPLHPGGLHQGGAAQLHDHAGRPSRPAARCGIAIIIIESASLLFALCMLLKMSIL